MTDVLTAKYSIPFIDNEKLSSLLHRTWSSVQFVLLFPFFIRNHLISFGEKTVTDLKNLKDAGDNNENAQPSTKMDETREEQGITGNGRKVYHHAGFVA